ncbi:hypothetical protein PN480_06630, partial [Dolichospermum circinale CS-1225]
IFLCRIWKIEDIQTVLTVKTVPCSLFPVLTDNLFSKPYLKYDISINNSVNEGEFVLATM